MGSLPPPAKGGSERIIRIDAGRGWKKLALFEIWEYRDLFWFHILKNIKAKYRQMALGPIWIILQPVINMIVFTLIFGKVAKLDSGGIPYPLLTYAALLPWLLFQNSCAESSNSLVAQMGIISKVYFPRLIVPLSATLAWLVDFLISFSVLIALMVFYGVAPTWKILTIPLFLLFAILTSLGVGLWTASLAVRFRDVKLVVTYGLRVFMLLSPVAYSSGVVPDHLQWLYQLNPLYWIIEGFRWALVGGEFGPTLYMLVPLGAVLCLVISGAYMFKRTERTVVDLL